jgi:hypothetical protein
MDERSAGGLIDEQSAGGPFAFFRRRWRRQAPLKLLFWRDMVVVGTAINVATAVASLMALGMKAGLPLAMFIFFAPLPYNIFLVAAVWRTADLAEASTASSVRFGAMLWLVVATLL